MAQAKVTIQGKEPEIIELPKDVSTENWWAGVQREKSPTIILNNTTYLKRDIIGVTELRVRRGFTNMDGI